MAKWKLSEGELEKAKSRIGQPCEHHSNCPTPSKYAVGDWYPTPGNYVYCEQHVFIGHGAATYPDLPKDHPRAHSLSERHKFGV